MPVDRCVWIHLLVLVSMRQRRDRDVATPAGTHHGLHGLRRGGTRRAHPHRDGHGGSARLPQGTADTAGADSLVIAAAGLLAWVVWAWGVLGLALTAVSDLPGMVGGAARLATHVVLPAGARPPPGLAGPPRPRGPGPRPRPRRASPAGRCGHDGAGHTGRRGRPRRGGARL